jgi:quercetin dioxygenase-like cupin family protein
MFLPLRAIVSRRLATVAILLLCLLTPVFAGDKPGHVTPLLTKPLVGIPGKEVTMITVEYPPGGTDPVHRHNASAFLYVLEGSIVMQMKGGKQVTLHSGDIFYEDPRRIHLVGRNASKTKPAKFLVFLVKDRNAPILIPVTAAATTTSR